MGAHTRDGDATDATSSDTLRDYESKSRRTFIQTELFNAFTEGRLGRAQGVAGLEQLTSGDLLLTFADGSTQELSITARSPEFSERHRLERAT